MMKSKTVNISNINFDVKGLAPIEGYEDRFSHFSEGRKGELANTAGAKVQIDAVMLRTFAAEPYHLTIKLGGKLIRIASFDDGSEVIKQLKAAGAITEYGPSPSDIARNERRERKLEEERNIEERARQVAADRARAEKEKRDSFIWKAREEARERMGINVQPKNAA